MAQQKSAAKTGGNRRSSIKTMKKAEKSRSAKDGSVGDEEVSLDRRRGSRRSEEQGDAGNATDAAPLERRKKVNRRRQIDPTTCERDYTDQEVEFMNALDDYKRKSGRMFPTCSEVLEVIRGLGYVKLSGTELGTLAVGSNAASSAKPMPTNWPATTANQFDIETAQADYETHVAF